MHSASSPPRANALNAVRLALALVVIVSHAPRPLGQSSPTWGGLEIGGWAVAGFFGISGYLICQSRDRLPLGRFLWHRVLRIMPAFWVCLLATALVFAPLAVLLGGGRTTVGAAIGYVVGNAGLHVLQPTIDGTLGDSGTSIWNLSLWTLEIEFLAYLALGLAALVRGLTGRLGTATAFVLMTVAAVAVELSDTGQLIGGIARLGSFFAAGVLLQRFGLPFSARWAAASVVALAVMASLDAVSMVGGLPLAYLALWLGHVVRQPSWMRAHDLSYGCYLYAFPVAQLLFLGGVAEAGYVVYGLATTVLALGCAAASWLLVERPALAWKSLPAPRLVGSVRT